MSRKITLTPDVLEQIIAGLRTMGIDIQSSDSAEDPSTRPASPAPTESTGDANNSNQSLNLRRQVPATTTDVAQAFGDGSDLRSPPGPGLAGGIAVAPPVVAPHSHVGVAITAAGSVGQRGLIGPPPSAASTSGSGTGSDRVGFTCNHCGHHNAVSSSGGDYFYCITVGTRIGVVHTWFLTQPHVIGVRGACYRRFSTEAAAQAAFAEALAAGHVRIIDAHGTIIARINPGDEY